LFIQIPKKGLKMKDFVKRSNSFLYAANEQFAQLVGKIGPLGGITDSYLAFLQHKRNRIDGWAIMWWAWTGLSDELKQTQGDITDRRQKVAAILNTFAADMETIHARFEMRGAFVNYDFWLNVESWADEFVSTQIDRRIPESAGEEQRKLRDALHQFWLSFLNLPPQERRGVGLAIDLLRQRVYEIFGFNTSH
jgi:hypothetical protein